MWINHKLVDFGNAAKMSGVKPGCRSGADDEDEDEAEEKEEGGADEGAIKQRIPPPPPAGLDEESKGMQVELFPPPSVHKHSGKWEKVTTKVIEVVIDL